MIRSATDSGPKPIIRGSTIPLWPLIMVFVAGLLLAACTVTQGVTQPASPAVNTANVEPPTPTAAAPVAKEAPHIRHATSPHARALAKVTAHSSKAESALHQSGRSGTHPKSKGTTTTVPVAHPKVAKQSSEPLPLPLPPATAPSGPATTPPVAATSRSVATRPEPLPPAPAPTTSPTVPAASTPAAPTGAPLRLSADKLPYTVGDWTLERNWDNKHPGVCRLVSKRQTMDDGYDRTSIWAEIRAAGIDIHTGSNIDLSYQGSGIQLDDSVLHPVTRLVGRKGVEVSGDFADQLVSANSLSVHLGFWPTWPKTRLQQARIPMDGISALMPSFLNCKQL